MKDDSIIQRNTARLMVDLARYWEPGVYPPGWEGERLAAPQPNDTAPPKQQPPQLVAMKPKPDASAPPLSATVQARAIHSAIERHMESLILAPSMGAVRAAFCNVFAAAYDAIADARLAQFPPRDETEFARDLRHTVPNVAIGFLEAAITSETLLSANLKPSLFAALSVLRNLVDSSAPIPRGRKEGAVVNLAGLLHDEAVRCAFRRSATWAEDHSSVDPIRADLAKVHQSRFDMFVDERRLDGVKVTKSAIATAALVDRTDLRRYLCGEHGPDSEITRRIERVFGGETKLDVSRMRSRGRVTVSANKLIPR